MDTNNNGLIASGSNPANEKNIPSTSKAMAQQQNNVASEPIRRSSRPLKKVEFFHDGILSYNDKVKVKTESIPNINQESSNEGVKRQTARKTGTPTPRAEIINEKQSVTSRKIAKPKSRIRSKPGSNKPTESIATSNRETVSGRSHDGQIFLDTYFPKYVTPNHMYGIPNKNIEIMAMHQSIDGKTSYIIHRV